MIKIYTQSTHCRIVYDEATGNEILLSEKILTEKFRARDTSLRRNSLVRRGLMSDIRLFYNKDMNILPVGFLKFLEYYYEKSGIEYVIKEMRKFPKPDKEFLRKLLKKEISFGDIKPRDYQIEAVIEAVRNKMGGLELSTGLGKTLIMALLCKAYPNCRILILENSISLIQQTYEKFLEFGFGPEMGVIQGSNFDDEKRITLLTLQSYEKAFHLFPQIQVILADEGHETARTNESEKVIYSCQNANIKFSISATMQTIDNPYESMRLVGNMGPVVYEMPLEDGIDSDFLTETKVQIYNYNCDPVGIIGSWGDVYDTVVVDENNTV